MGRVAGATGLAGVVVVAAVCWVSSTSPQLLSRVLARTPNRNAFVSAICIGKTSYLAVTTTVEAASNDKRRIYNIRAKKRGVRKRIGSPSNALKVCWLIFNYPHNSAVISHLYGCGAVPPVVGKLLTSCGLRIDRGR